MLEVACCFIVLVCGVDFGYDFVVCGWIELLFV